MTGKFFILFLTILSTWIILKPSTIPKDTLVEIWFYKKQLDVCECTRGAGISWSAMGVMLFSPGYYRPQLFIDRFRSNSYQNNRYHSQKYPHEPDRFYFFMINNCRKYNGNYKMHSHNGCNERQRPAFQGI